MLAKVYDHSQYRPGMLLQPKLNGIRCLYQNGHMFSREGEVWSTNCLTHIRHELDLLGVGDNILDGELYVHGMSLQQINSRVAVKRVEPHKDEAVIQYHIFDYVSRENMVERCVKLCSLFRESLPLTSVKLVPTFVSRSKLDADRHHERFKSSGYEGTMYRHPARQYAIVGEHRRKDNRVDWLLKRKDWLDLDAVVVRVLPGNPDGRFCDTMGSFELDYNGTRFEAGSGPTDMERAEYWRLRDRLAGCRVKIKYEMFSDGGVPLKPVIIQVDLP